MAESYIQEIVRKSLVGGLVGGVTGAIVGEGIVGDHVELIGIIGFLFGALAGFSKTAIDQNK